MTPKRCGQCGQPHAACTAHRRDGQPCGMKPVKGLRVCRMHGGSTKRAKAKSERKQAEDQAHAAVVTFGLPREIHPAMALLEEVHRTAGHVAWLEVKIRQLGDDDLVWGMTRIKEGGDDRGTTYEAKPNAWLVEYRTERKHLVDVCSAALKAGVDERRVRLAEDQGMQLGRVIQAILRDLQLTPAQQALVGEVVPRHIRALEATA